MRVLLINKFFFPFGGTETALFQTAKLLRGKGHQVIFFSMSHAKNIPSQYARFFVSRVDFETVRGWRQKIRGVERILFGRESRRRLEELLRVEKPDVAHLHNIYHHLSPGIIATLKKHGIPVVMTLHDYKLVCPAYRLFVHGKTCQRCRNGRFVWCFLKKCMKNSRSKSLIGSCEAYLHRRHYHLIDRLIVPSHFLQEKIAALGFTGTCIHVPNFASMSLLRPASRPTYPKILFFGRLVEEKGVEVLIDAMAGLDAECLIVGDGPLEKALRDRARRANRADIRFLGHQPHRTLASLIRRATMVIIPSIWFENNPFSILEAFALGVPVIASRIGGIPELIEHGKTGLMFTPGDPDDLREKIKFLLNCPPERRRLARCAKQWAGNGNGREKHYSQLMAVYRSLISENPGAAAPRAESVFADKE